MKRRLALFFTVLVLCIEVISLLVVAKLPNTTFIVVENWWAELLITLCVIFHIAIVAFVYTFATLKYRFLMALVACLFCGMVGMLFGTLELAQLDACIALIVILALCGLPLGFMARSMWPSHEADSLNKE